MTPRRPPTRLHLPLPEFVSNRKKWCRAIHARLGPTTEPYPSTARLAMEVRVYLPRDRWNRIDVDNALKQVMDALQGNVGGEGKKRQRQPVLICEDSQVYRAEIAKTSPKRGMEGGYVKIRVLPGRHQPVRKVR